MNVRHAFAGVIVILAMVLGVLVGRGQTTGGTIEGRVLRYGTTEGIGNVRVTLTGGAARGAARGATPAVPQTDGSGRFSFRGLAPGDYSIRAEHDAYLGIPLPGSAWAPQASSVRVTVREGQASMEARIYLIRASTMAGRVRGRNGAPAAGIQVTAYRKTYGDDGRIRFSAADEAKTDDRGEYRFLRLAPGEHWIAAAPARLTATSRIPPNIPVTTFYPNTADPGTASAIPVSEGVDLPGVDITMQEQPALTIQGRLTNTLKAPANQPANQPTVTFYLIPREAHSFPGSSNPAPAVSSINRSSGQFEIVGVTPGAYDLVAVVPLYDANGARTIFPESVRVNVGDRSVTGIDVTIRPGSQTQARVLVDGAVVSSPLPSLRSLEPYPIPFELAPALEVVRDRSGVVTFNNVPRGRFTFDVGGLPSNAYIVDIRPGPAFYEQGFEVPGESGAVFDIHIRTDGATVRGTVRDSEGRAVSNGTVVLAPAQPRRGNPELFKTARTDSAGGFSISGVVPGESRIFAWREVPPNAWLNPEFLEPYEGFGRAISAVGQGSVEADVVVLTILDRR